MAHHAVEVEGPGRARIELDGGHLRQGAQFFRHALRKIGGDRQGRALRHVEHHREFRFVVQGQHLYRNPIEDKEGAGEEEGAPENEAEKGPLGLALDKGGQDLAEALLELFRPLVLALFRRLQIVHGGP